MKTLLSQPAEVIDLVEAYSVPSGTGNRPFVRCNMISTLDGAITINCLSGLLGGSADRGLFQVVRSLADIILGCYELPVKSLIGTRPIQEFSSPDGGDEPCAIGLPDVARQSPHAP